MATIKKQGKGYKITVSCGYDAHGKQRREHMTWIPDPNMSEAKLQKELQRQAVLFEERIRNDGVMDSRIKFEAFAQKYMEEYAALYLKKKTYYGYHLLLPRINDAIGHIRLCELKTAHINAFYRNLQERGVRADGQAVSKVDLRARVKERGVSQADFARSAGLCEATVKHACQGKTLSYASAAKIAAALGAKPADLFDVAINEEPLHPHTLLHYHRTLHGILSKAVQWGYISVNPADRAEKPKYTPEESPYLEVDEAMQLLDLLQEEPPQWRVPVMFDLFSGLRRGELLGLRWEDVDLDKQVLHVRRTYNFIPHVGHYIDTPKNATSRRPLKLSRSAVLLLLEYKAWQDARREELGDAWADQDGRVFTNDGGAPIPPSSLTGWFSSFIKRSGLPHVTIHSLRHTYASMMITDGVPLIVVSRQLGHSKVTTTANIYAHVIAEAEAQAGAVIDDKFSGYVTQKEQPKPKKSKAAGA